MTNFDVLFEEIAETRRTSRERVFDWDKAARILSEKKPYQAWAGLGGDFCNTGDVIYQEGNVVTDSDTYLSSYWATPTLLLMGEDDFAFEEGESIPCWKYKDESEWDASTTWPKSSIDILTKEG